MNESNEYGFFSLPEDVRQKIIEILGIDPAVLNPLRTVNKEFNATILNFIKSYFNRISYRIKKLSNEIESTLREDGKIEISKELEFLQIIEYVNILKRVGVPVDYREEQENKMSEITNLYVNHIRNLIINLTEMNEENIESETEKLSKKDACTMIIKNASILGCFHLLWEKNEDSKFNKYLKNIIQDHINEVSISGGNLSIKDFRNADLAGVKFGNKANHALVNLEDAKFENANLHDTDFSGAYRIPLKELGKANCLIGLEIMKNFQSYQPDDPPFAGSIKTEGAILEEGLIIEHDKWLLQKRMVEHYKEYFLNTTDFYKILITLNKLVVSKKNLLKEAVIKADTFAKAYISYLTLPFHENYYRTVVEAARNKLVELVKSGKIQIRDNQKVRVNTLLGNVFKESFGSNSLKLFDKTDNQKQLDLVLEKLNLVELSKNRMDGPQ